MLRLRRGRVLRALERRRGAALLEVAVEGEDRPASALAYDTFSPALAPGQEVLLNTTARHLGLGTGGLDLVLPQSPGAAPDGPPASELPATGHIVKLRYTPLQFTCLAVEEAASPHHQALKDPPGLGGMPVLACGLHSQVGPVAAALSLLTGGRARLAYVMTEGGALPIAVSRLVAGLRERGLICSTITCGHAFGGDLEAVNLYSGLLAARWAAEADAAVVAMGPGVVGTGTRYGFSGAEQAQIVDAANALGGLALAVARLSFADPRPRHCGLSHHTLTALGRLARSPAVVCLPRLSPPLETWLKRQIEAEPGMARHRLAFVDGSAGITGLERFGLEVTTMGRGRGEDPAFFLACGAAAVQAAGVLEAPDRVAPPWPPAGCP